MSTLSILVAVWGVLAVTFIALMIYRGNLANHETDQLFLNEDQPSAVHRENDAVVRRMTTLQPICMGVGGLAAVMTLAVAGVWVKQLMVSF